MAQFSTLLNYVGESTESQVSYTANILKVEKNEHIQPIFDASMQSRSRVWLTFKVAPADSAENDESISAQFVSLLASPDGQDLTPELRISSSQPLAAGIAAQAEAFYNLSNYNSVVRRT